MNEEPIKITGLLPPLEDKLKSLKKKISSILSKPKSERKRKWLRTLFKEARRLQKVLREHRKVGSFICCPNCNHKFTVQSE